MGLSVIVTSTKFWSERTGSLTGLGQPPQRPLLIGCWASIALNVSPVYHEIKVNYYLEKAHAGGEGVCTTVFSTRVMLLTRWPIARFAKHLFSVGRCPYLDRSLLVILGMHEKMRILEEMGIRTWQRRRGQGQRLAWRQGEQVQELGQGPSRGQCMAWNRKSIDYYRHPSPPPEVSSVFSPPLPLLIVHLTCIHTNPRYANHGHTDRHIHTRNPLDWTQRNQSLSLAPSPPLVNIQQNDRVHAPKRPC